MPSSLVTLVKINVSNTGSGAITLGSAAEGYRGREILTNGTVYSYSIQQGSAWEFGRGTYLSESAQLVRSVIDSSDGGTAISLRPNAQVSLTAIAEDLMPQVQVTEGIQADREAAEAARTGAETAKGLAETAAGTATTQAGNSASSATLSQEWAEGTEPGGPGTDSAKGHADRAETLADNLNDRLTVIDQPGASEGGTISLADGTIVQEYLPNGVAVPAFGTTRLPIVSEDKEFLGETTGSVADNGLRVAAYDEETGALLFGVDENDQFFCKLDPSVIPPSPSSEEVVAARGTAADLSERLSRALTPAGSPKASVQNLDRLRVLRSALTHLKLGGSALVHIILDGDSWLDSKAYGSTDAITRFYAESGLTNAGPGWIGLGSGQGGGGGIHGTALNNISVTRTGTWTDLFPSASGSPGTPQNFPGYDAARSDANGSIYTVTGSVIGNCTSLTLFCGKGSGIEQSWDGSTWNAVTVTAGSGSTTATIDMTGKSNSLRLRCANGAIVAGLFGLTGSSGVVFSNLSNSGSTAVQKATVQANADYQATLAAFPADAVTVLVQLGLNDTKASTAVDTITDAVGDVVAGYRAAFDGFPSCDIIVACQPNTPQSVQDTLAPLLRVYAEDNDCAFLDWQGFYGPIASSGDYASYSRDYTSGAASTALPLLEVDTGYRHPSPNSDLVAAGKNAVLSGANLVAGALSGVFLSAFRSN